jgi:hypothetical protein
MEEFVLVIPILAMVLTYKLLSKMIEAKQARRLTAGRPVPPLCDKSYSDMEESPEELRARAELMQRRIQVLEEIIASERKDKELA